MDKLDRSGAAAGLGLLNLDHIYNNVCDRLVREADEAKSWRSVPSQCLK